MPNYIINECITNDVYILSAVTLTSGATVEFGISETPFCGTVGAVTLSAETLNINFVKLYDDCCACLEGDGRESLNFHFIRCGTDEDISIEATNFCSEYGVPTTGLTYEIQFSSGTPFCATFEGLSDSGTTNYFYVSGSFSGCEDCEEVPPTPTPTPTVTPTNTPSVTPTKTVTPTVTPTKTVTPTVTPTNTPTPSFTPNYTYSSGTEYVDCVICDTVATTVNVPHPVAVNNQGNAVVQLGAVTLGGPNGLNN